MSYFLSFFFTSVMNINIENKTGNFDARKELLYENDIVSFITSRLGITRKAVKVCLLCRIL